MIVTMCHGVGPVTIAEIAEVTGHREDRIRTDVARLHRDGYLRQRGTPSGGLGVGWVSTGRWNPDTDPYPHAAHPLTQ